MTHARPTGELRELASAPGFGPLLAAAIQSEFGDQLARVALALLVFDRSGSPLATSFAYALTFIPAIGGGFLLGSLADRMPRRCLMIGCDVIRAALIGLIGLFQLPLGAVYVLVAATVLLGTPFSSAQLALLTEIVGGRLLIKATGLLRSADQVAALAGFGVGGAIISLVGSRAGLLIDAATFFVSSIIIAAGIPRPASVTDYADPSPLPQRGVGDQRPTVRQALRLVFGDRHLRALLALACLVGLYVAPEALAAPYAREIGGGPIAVGLLLSASAAGAAIGSVVLGSRAGRLASRNRFVLRPLAGLAASCGLPLVACWASPPLIASLTLWMLSGGLSAYVVVTTGTYSLLVPGRIRGTAIAVGSAFLLTSQGAASLVGGIIADRWSAAAGIGVLAALGVIAACAIGFLGPTGKNPAPQVASS